MTSRPGLSSVANRNGLEGRPRYRRLVRARDQDQHDGSIKAATEHEVAWFAKVKANGYNPATPTGSFTAVDAHKLIAFQHAHCGITGP